MGKTQIKKLVASAKRKFVEDIREMVAVVEADSGSYDSSFRAIENSNVGLANVVWYVNKTIKYSADKLIEQVHGVGRLADKMDALEAILSQHMHVPQLRIGRGGFVIEVIEYDGCVCKTELKTIEDAVREVNRCAVRVARDATAIIQEA